MDWAAVAYPFSLGLVAAFNPCGFALLPAYLSYFIGASRRALPRTRRPAHEAAGRGAARPSSVGLTLTAGFVAVFGALRRAFRDRPQPGRRARPHRVCDDRGGGRSWRCWESGCWPGAAINLRLPKMSRGTEGRGLPSVFMFGVSYAVVSLSCTIGLFIAAITASFFGRPGLRRRRGQLRGLRPGDGLGDHVPDLGSGHGPQPTWVSARCARPVALDQPGVGADAAGVGRVRGQLRLVGACR